MRRRVGSDDRGIWEAYRGQCIPASEFTSVPVGRSVARENSERAFHMEKAVGRLADAAAISATISELAASFGNRLVTSTAVRQQHANTTTWIRSEPPDAVIYPQSTEDVQQVVRICAPARVPII